MFRYCGECYRAFYQGSKELLSSSPEQVDILAGRVTLRCPIGKGTGQSSSDKSLTLKAPRVISSKFLLVISMLCKTEWS